MTNDPLRVLVVDDERPALDELAYLLGRDERIGEIHTAASGHNALRLLREVEVDAVFLDIQMPGLSGLELARALGELEEQRPEGELPRVVFVTAHEQHAVDAFDLHAVDYVLKPVREDRLAEAVRRLLAAHGAPPSPGDEQVTVERAGVTRFLRRSEIRYVETAGDYARLHIGDDSFLLRTPLTTLEASWEEAGFVRVHRSLLVNLAHVTQVRTEQGRCTVVVEGVELAVSRRHTRALRDRLAARGSAP